jgi:polyhydroxybutyrate depolymerase
MTTRRRGTVLGGVLALLALPVVIAVAEATWFRTHMANNGRLTSAGLEREYLVYVPKSYDARTPTSLVIVLHGAGLYPGAQRDFSRWNEVADRHGFIVVYGAGRTSTGPRIWRVGPGPSLHQDVQYVSDVIDTLSTHYNIDPRRVYANGLSNGGGMSFALSCLLSHRIAAVGLVASAQTMAFELCPDSTPVPMIMFHGTADNAAPYEGGLSYVVTKPFPSMPRWAALWARRNRCDGKPVDSLVAPDVSVRAWRHCENDAEVKFYTIIGGGHTWPGGGPHPQWFVGRMTRSINASATMWEFFQRHPLRAVPQR